MSPASPRLLFVPVSGASGMGEYGRALAMASAVATRWPEAKIHFVLSREAPYAAGVPFPATLLPASPTFHSEEVVTLIRSFQPTVVIFDNAGRTAQLRAAKQSGAAVVFVSARGRQRRKAFRLRWMHLIDEHWIAYPRLLAGEPGIVEQLKLRALGRPWLRFLDPLLPRPDDALGQALLDRLGVRSNDYIAVVPGGGTEHAGTGNALQAVADTASLLAARGIQVVLVGLDSLRRQSSPYLHVTPRLPLSELVELMRHSRLVIANGGYTLAQALACDRSCIAVALAKDQSRRIDRCVAAGVALRGQPDAAALEQAVVELSSDSQRLEGLRLARATVGIHNGAEEMVAALAGLVSKCSPMRPPPSAG